MSGEDGWARYRTSCWWIFVGALAVRIAYLVLFESFPFGSGDDVIYDSVAKHLVAGRGFVLENRAGVLEPQLRVGPVYPLFIAGVYELFGQSAFAVRMAQAVLGALTAMLVCRIAWLTVGGTATRTAGVIAAVHPALIVYTGVILTEVSFAFLLVTAVWLAIEAWQRASAGWWAAAGIAFGASALLRTEALLMAPLIAAGILYFNAPPSRLRMVAVFSLAMAVTVGVWTARNYRHFGEFVPVSTHGGTTLWITAMGWSEWRYDDPAYRALPLEGLGEIEQSQFLQREAVRIIAADPLGYLAGGFRRVGELWVGSHTTYLVGFSGSFREYAAAGESGRVVVKAAMLAINAVLVALAIPGLWAAFHGAPHLRARLWMCAVPLLTVTAVHFFLYSGARYHVPVLPFVALFAAAAFARGVDTASARWQPIPARANPV